jgi:hypothetical protein
MEISSILIGSTIFQQGNKMTSKKILGWFTAIGVTIGGIFAGVQYTKKPDTTITAPAEATPGDLMNNSVQK